MRQDELNVIEVRANKAMKGGPIDHAPFDVIALLAEIRRLKAGLIELTEEWSDVQQRHTISESAKDTLANCASQVMEVIG